MAKKQKKSKEQRALDDVAREFGAVAAPTTMRPKLAVGQVFKMDGEGYVRIEKDIVIALKDVRVWRSRNNLMAELTRLEGWDTGTDFGKGRAKAKRMDEIRERLLKVTEKMEECNIIKTIHGKFRLVDPEEKREAQVS